MLWPNYRQILSQGLRVELADRERLISPVLFAMTVQLLFAFAVGDVQPDLKPRMLVASTFLTAFFALQMSFARVFEPDRQDQVFEIMRTYPLSYMAWFLAKYTLVLITGLAVVLPTLVFGVFLNQATQFPLVMFGVALLALAGLSALGILLSALTLKSHARQILYPLLYFPLTAPVLLAAVQASLLSLEAGAADSLSSWLGLLLAFDVIYVTLGLMLFEDLVS